MVGCGLFETATGLRSLASSGGGGGSFVVRLDCAAGRGETGARSAKADGGCVCTVVTYGHV